MRPHRQHRHHRVPALAGRGTRGRAHPRPGARPTSDFFAAVRTGERRGSVGARGPRFTRPVARPVTDGGRSTRPRRRAGTRRRTGLGNSRPSRDPVPPLPHPFRGLAIEEQSPCRPGVNVGARSAIHHRVPSAVQEACPAAPPRSGTRRVPSRRPSPSPAPADRDTWVPSQPLPPSSVSPERPACVSRRRWRRRRCRARPPAAPPPGRPPAPRRSGARAAASRWP